jgi:hypothetical protein
VSVVIAFASGEPWAAANWRTICSAFFGRTT